MIAFLLLVVMVACFVVSSGLPRSRPYPWRDRRVRHADPVTPKDLGIDKSKPDLDIQRLTTGTITAESLTASSIQCDYFPERPIPITDEMIREGAITDEMICRGSINLPGSGQLMADKVVAGSVRLRMDMSLPDGTHRLVERDGYLCAEQDAQVGDVTGRDDLEVDDIPAVHVLRDLGD